MNSHFGSYHLSESRQAGSCGDIRYPGKSGGWRSSALSVWHVTNAHRMAVGSVKNLTTSSQGPVATNGVKIGPHNHYLEGPILQDLKTGTRLNFFLARAAKEIQMLRVFSVFFVATMKIIGCMGHLSWGLLRQYCSCASRVKFRSRRSSAAPTPLQTGAAHWTNK